MDRVKTAAASYIGAAFWWLCDKLWGDQFFAWIKPMIPVWLINGMLLADIAKHLLSWGPPIALALLGTYLLLRKRVGKPANSPLNIRYDPHSHELGERYRSLHTHPQTKQVTTLHAISIENASASRQVDCQLTVLFLRDKIDKAVRFESRSLRSASIPTNDGKFSLNPGDMIFFDVAARYKAEPNVIAVCGSIGIARVPTEDAPYVLSIRVSAPESNQDKKYRFYVDKGDELAFAEVSG